MTQLRTILDGGLYFEGPRWHDGRLWFVDCMARTLLSVSPAGDAREHATFDDTPCGTGVLPDGRLVILTMFKKRLFTWASGELAPYADLSAIATGTLDDMIVDGLGRAWVGDLGFDMPPPPGRGDQGRIILVMPDGAARVAAEGLRFPNGMAVSADNRRLVVAEMDGACLADFSVEADGLRLERKLASCPRARRHLPRPRGRGVGRVLRRGRVRPHRQRRPRAGAPCRARPPRHRLCAGRAGAAHAVLPQRPDLARGDAAAQVVVPHRCGGCGYPRRGQSLNRGTLPLSPCGRGWP